MKQNNEFCYCLNCSYKGPQYDQKLRVASGGTVRNGMEARIDLIHYLN
jgi:hypothetical protein